MPQTLAEVGPTDVRRRSWTVDDFLRMDDAGLFRDERVELLEGEVYLLSPQRWEHSSTLDRIAEILRSLPGRPVWVRSRLPLRVGESSMPEPDVSVVAGRRDDYGDHPTTALLVVEVSLSTLAYDRRKASVYAEAGVPEYWIVDLTNQKVEVRRDPGVLPDDTRQPGYRIILSFARGSAITPLSHPDASIEVDRLLG